MADEGSPPKKRCWCIRIVLALLLLFGLSAIVFYYFRVPLLIKAAELWIVNDPPRKADAILVLGGGVGWRPLEAAKLYTNGYASKVLVINVRPDATVELGINPAESELVAAVLESRGVPKEAIVTIGNSCASTYEDIRAAAVWARTNKATGILIPTDLFHTRRVRWTADHLIASAGVRIQVLAVEPPEYSLTNWFTTEQGIVAFNNEAIKYLLYRGTY
jgi:uncharacterized SAM-binding protein YcdF (DUF218 family)